MNKGFNTIGFLGLGGLLMYLFDPQAGRRRRAVGRDKMNRLARKTLDAADVTSRDLKNRLTGLAARTRRLVGNEEASDRVLAERVRANLGAWVKHPGSLDVTARYGTVVLSGPILASEADTFLRQVRAIPGVQGIEDHLVVHESAGAIPGLQGEPGQRKAGNAPDVLQNRWSPSTRFIAGTFGASLALYGARQLSVLGTTLAGLGGAVLARALANMPLRRLTGFGADRRAVEVNKTINIAAPVQEVFAFWNDYTNFPRFMSNVRHVQDCGNNRSHWVVAGPAGVSMEWDAVLTAFEPNRKLGWETVPDSTIQHAGTIRFDPNENGGTRIDIRMSYNPIAGALGHAVASLFGADAKSQMDADLARMKNMIETGIRPHDAARKGETAYTT